MNILILTDLHPLGTALARLLQPELPPHARTFHLLYSECPVYLSLERIRDTRLFILDLFRTYPGGMRAEGVALALQLVRLKKQFLVVSPLSLGRRVNIETYWDLDSEESLVDRILRLARSQDAPGDLPRRTVDIFGPLLRVPPQHSVE
jgi:hypothetical protein